MGKNDHDQAPSPEKKHPPRGGWRPGAGRKAGRKAGFQAPTVAAAEAAIMRIVNDMYLGREVEVRKRGKVKVETVQLDPQIGNACLSGLKAVLHSKQRYLDEAVREEIAGLRDEVRNYKQRLIAHRIMQENEGERPAQTH